MPFMTLIILLILSCSFPTKRRILHPQREVVLDGELVYHVEFLEQAPTSLPCVPGLCGLYSFSVQKGLVPARSRVLRRSGS